MPAPPQRSRPVRIPAAQSAGEPHVQAAVSLARALRARGLVAQAVAGADGVARVLVITPAGARLAERVCTSGQDGKLWFCWSGGPFCPADDINAAADKIAHVLAPRFMAGT